MTFKQLKDKVARIASALKKCGIKNGDRVVGKILLDFFLISFLIYLVNKLTVWSGIIFYLSNIQSFFLGLPQP